MNQSNSKARQAGSHTQHSPEDASATLSGIDADTDAGVGDNDGVTLGQLYNELRSGDVVSNTDSVRLVPEQHSEAVLEDVTSTLFGQSSFQFRESVVKENLDEILLLLVAHRSSETNGKSLMSDLATVFDTRLSPGTLYPQLHELEDEGLLTVQELVRTKEYRVDDEEALAERVTAAAEQHLALGLFFHAALEDLS
jgi:hypothetical protein